MCSFVCLFVRLFLCFFGVFVCLFVLLFVFSPQGHTSYVNTAAYMLDGAKVVTGSADGTVKVNTHFPVDCGVTATNWRLLCRNVVQRVFAVCDPHHLFHATIALAMVEEYSSTYFSQHTVCFFVRSFYVASPSPPPPFAAIYMLPASLSVLAAPHRPAVSLPSPLSINPPPLRLSLFAALQVWDAKTTENLHSFHPAVSIGSHTEASVHTVFPLPGSTEQLLVSNRTPTAFVCTLQGQVVRSFTSPKVRM